MRCCALARHFSGVEPLAVMVLVTSGSARIAASAPISASLKASSRRRSVVMIGMVVTGVLRALGAHLLHAPPCDGYGLHHRSVCAARQNAVLRDSRSWPSFLAAALSGWRMRRWLWTSTTPATLSAQS